MVVSHAVERSQCQLPIVKVRRGAEVSAVFGEVGPVWFGVHWAGGRQHLCCASDALGCPLCSVASSRVVGITFAVIRIASAARVFLLEVSPLAWSQFEARCRFDGLNLCDGVVATVTRPRARGCLVIEPTGIGEQGPLWLDAERRLLRAWAVLYGLPLPTLEETFSEFQARISAVVEIRAEVAAAAVRK